MKRPITFFSSICIILFLAAIGYFSFSIYEDRKNGIDAADARFAKLLDDTESIVRETKKGTPEFSSRFIQAIENIDDYSALKLQIDGQTVYSYPPQGFTIPSPDLIKSYKKSRLLSNGANFTLSASIYLIKAKSIYIHCRLPFIFILSGTLIAILVLCIVKGDSKSLGQRAAKLSKLSQNTQDFKTTDIQEKTLNFQEDADNSKHEETAFDHIFDEDDTVYQDDGQESQESANENILSISEKSPSQEENASYDEISEGSNTLDEEQSFDDEQPSYVENDDDTFDESQSYTKNDDDETFDESGMDLIDELEQQNMELSEFESSDPIFDDTPALDSSIESTMTDDDANAFDASSIMPSSSPVTGLKTYTQFEQELSTSLGSSNQENISIAFLRVKDLNRGNPISKAVVSILADNFKDTAEIYEFQADGYALICKGYDLNSTVNTFDTLYDKITGYLKLNNTVNDVIIGISSKEGRTLQSDRIIAEAERALQHAEEDTDSPIIAFKANPQKFQEYETSKENLS